MSFVHLHVHSPYSFVDGASSLEALVQRAASFGMPALALTDHDSLAGAVKFTALCKGYGITPILGSEITLDDESHLTLLAQNRTGYANLCRLLTLSYAHGGRLSPRLPWGALEAHTEGLICLTGCRRGRIHSLTRDHRYDEAEVNGRRLLEWFGKDHLWIELVDDFTPDCHRVCRELVELAQHLGVGTVVTNNVHYATRRDFPAHDILACIQAGITVGDIHSARPLNFERWLKPASKMAELFGWCPEALANSIQVAEQCEAALPAIEQMTPRHPSPEGHDSASYLRHLSYKGARFRYKTLTPRIEARLDHELDVVCELGYADYMLLAWQVARWARAQGIRCTGRGSAADSCVAYALMLTDVDVIARNLPFARFLVPGKTPDIDLDFEAQRRDEVFEYIKRLWGVPNVAMACTFHSFWAKSALRDVGKALALPADALRFFTDHIAHFVRADKLEAAFESNPELKPHAHLTERFKLLFELCGKIAGFPRHIGTHSSGVVISRLALDTIAPIMPTARGVMPLIQLDKDDVEIIGGLKLDVLSLRILSAVQDTEADIQRSQPGFRYDRIPRDDPDTYRLIQSGQAMGAFQLESPAQMALAVVLSPRNFEDLVASVALIRPGPIRGNVVNRFVACRNGWTRSDVLHPCLIPILAKTYGCVVFQEQVIEVLAAMTGCTEAEADQMRKRLAKHDKLGMMEQAQAEFVQKACRHRPDLSFERALLIWQQIEGWSGYGFTEGHAASFAITAQRSASLSQHHPAAYFAAMMSNMPMGFYSANSLAAEARRRGVQVRPVEINASEDKCYAEETDAIRLGFRLVEGLRAADIELMLGARKERLFASLLDFCARVPIHRDLIENLILGGAFDLLHEHRRGLQWRLEETLGLAATFRRAESAVAQQSLTLGNAAAMATPVAEDIEDFWEWNKLMWSWRITGVCADCHPMAYARERLARYQIMPTHQALVQPHGTIITVAGINIRPHRPPTRSGRTVLFTTIEDEWGFLHLTCVGKALETYTPVFLLSAAVIVRGVVQRKGSGAFLLVEKVRPLLMGEFVQKERYSTLEAEILDAVEARGSHAH